MGRIGSISWGDCEYYTEIKCLDQFWAHGNHTDGVIIVVFIALAIINHDLCDPQCFLFLFLSCNWGKGSWGSIMTAWWVWRPVKGGENGGVLGIAYGLWSSLMETIITIALYRLTPTSVVSSLRTGVMSGSTVHSQVWAVQWTDLKWIHLGFIHLVAIYLCDNKLK